MRTAGLIGGMSWQSSAEYYRIINETVAGRLGGLHSAPCLLYSVDFAPIEKLQREGRWDEIVPRIIDAAQRLERAGADFFLFCTNTTHKIAEAVSAAVDIPMLHIADATGEAVKSQGVHRAALLGTIFTMEGDFWKSRIASRCGVEITVPVEADRRLLNDMIFQELCVGKIVDASRRECRRIIAALVAGGAQAIILGCTELPLLIPPSDAPVPLFDTTRIHAEKAAEMILAG